MEKRKKFRLIRRIIRFFQRRRAQLKAKRMRYDRLGRNKRDVELWKEKEELMTADYTDYRWRAQGKHSEKQRGQRHGSPGLHAGQAPERGQVPGRGQSGRQRHPSSPDPEATYGNPTSRRSMRNQRQEAMHAGHHSQCACLVVKQFTQDMHRKSEAEWRRKLPQHQQQQQPPTTSDVADQKRFCQPSHPHQHLRSISDHPEPQVHIPILRNNPWFTGKSQHLQQNCAVKKEATKLGTKLTDKVMEGAEMAKRLKHHAKALRLEAYQDLDQQDVYQSQYPSPPKHHTGCSPTCACVSVREFTRQTNQQHLHQPTTNHPVSMPMHSTNPFIETGKETIETSGKVGKHASSVANGKVVEGVEIDTRQTIHFQAEHGHHKPELNPLNNDHCGLPDPPTVMFHQIPMQSTNPFLTDAQEMLTSTGERIGGTVFSSIQHGAEAAGRLKHHAPGSPAYNRLHSDTTGDFLDVSDPRGILYSGDMIDSSDHSKMGSDTIENFLDEIDESTFHELKDLDQSSLCELQDLCFQLQTIIEEESEGDGEEVVRRGSHRSKRGSSCGPVQQVKIPVAVVPPQSFSTQGSTTEQISQQGKEVAKKAKHAVQHGAEMMGRAKIHAKSRFSYDQLGCESQGERSPHHSDGRIAIEFPMLPASNPFSASHPVDSEDRASEEPLPPPHQQLHDHNQQSHEHGEGCACSVVKRYTSEMERKDQEKRVSRDVENESKYGVKQVHIPISPNNPYIAQANALALGGKQSWKKDQGTLLKTKTNVTNKVQEGTEAASRINVHVKGKMQYDKLQNFEDNFNQMAINEIIKQDRMRMTEDRKKKDIKRSHSMPEPVQFQHAQQQGFQSPQTWVTFSDADSEAGIANIVREKSKNRSLRPVSEPAPQVVEDPVTGIRIYKAVKKTHRHSRSKSDSACRHSTPEYSSRYESTENTGNRHSLPQSFVQQQNQEQKIEKAKLSNTVIEQHSKSTKLHTAYDASILRQKHLNSSQHSKATDKNTSTQIHRVQVHAEPKTRHSLPADLKPETIELTDQEQRAQSFHEDPSTRARKKQDIEKWVDSVTKLSTSDKKEVKATGTPQTKHELWPRDYCEGNENQLNEISRNRALKRAKKKKSSKLKHKTGLKWVEYNSLVDLSQVAPEFDEEWEDEVDDKEVQNKAKRKSLKQKAKKRLGRVMKYVLEGVHEASKEGVYSPNTYYSNKSPHHRPRTGSMLR